MPHVGLTPTGASAGTLLTPTSVSGEWFRSCAGTDQRGCGGVGAGARANLFEKEVAPRVGGDVRAET